MHSPPPAPETVSAELPLEQPLAGERVAFTGTLASMTHRQAQDLVDQMGGTATQHVSRQTTVLVVGEEGWPLEEDGQPSVKLRQVLQWEQQGQPVRILQEGDWLVLLGLSREAERVRRHCTPAMLSQSLGVSVAEIRRWARRGLIRPVRMVYRLPYFDYQEATGAKRLAELVAAGVPLDKIAEGLQHLPARYERPLAQLQILAADRKMLLRDPKGLVEPSSGQRLFEFDDAAAEEPTQTDAAAATTRVEESLDSEVIAAPVPATWSATEWQETAGQRADEGDLSGATEALRMSLMDDPLRAETHFQLAENLYLLNQRAAALERYHMAIELDQQYLEAWIQLGCVYAEGEDFTGALHCFDAALQLLPECAEAHFHRAETLYRLGREAEARADWAAYLAHDQRGPWAELAQARLAALG